VVWWVWNRIEFVISQILNYSPWDRDSKPGTGLRIFLFITVLQRLLGSTLYPNTSAFPLDYRDQFVNMTIHLKQHFCSVMPKYYHHALYTHSWRWDDFVFRLCRWFFWEFCVVMEKHIIEDSSLFSSDAVSKFDEPNTSPFQEAGSTHNWELRNLKRRGRNSKALKMKFWLQKPRKEN
jgi:hypothetical protein